MLAVPSVSCAFSTFKDPCWSPGFSELVWWHFLGEENRCMHQQIPSIGERVTSMPRKKGMGSRQAGRQRMSGCHPVSS